MAAVMGVAADDELVQLAAHGDQRAFEALVGPYVDLGLRLAVTMLRDRSAAEDALQDAAFNAWRALPRLRPGSNLRAWFLTIVANQCRSRIRSRWWGVIRRPEVERAGADPAEASNLRSDLGRALLALEPVDRAAVYLHYCEDLPVDDVARSLGLTAAAVRSRIHRAVKRLRLELEVA